MSKDGVNFILNKAYSFDVSYRLPVIFHLFIKNVSFFYIHWLEMLYTEWEAAYYLYKHTKQLVLQNKVLVPNQSKLTNIYFLSSSHVFYPGRAVQDPWSTIKVKMNWLDLA